MGKNKSKYIEKSSGYTNSKPHEPTLMEQAFRDAEAQKNKGSSAPKLGTSPSIIKTVEPKPVVNPATTKQHSPDSPKSSNKTTHFQKQYSPKVQTQKNNPPMKKKPAVKLGLQLLPDKSLKIDTTNLYCEKSEVAAVPGERVEKLLTGISQGHRGYYKDEVDIVIGCDFGTSSSKIVIRDSGRQTAYAIPYSPFSCPGNVYLVPTKIYINEDGGIALSGGDHSFENMKVNVMDTADRPIFEAKNTSLSISALDLASAYISILILFARTWFLKHTASIYQKTHIHWHINIGIPSKSYDDETMRRNFKIIAMAAWRISMLKSQITIMDVKRIVMEARNYINPNNEYFKTEEFRTSWLHPDFVNTHPEVIMEVVGYSRSPLRTKGLHLLVDIGATTLDAATFIIHNSEGDHIYPLLDTVVDRLGTMVLHRKRMQAMITSMEKLLGERNSIDPNIPLPDLSYYEVQLDHKGVSESDGIFLQECDTKVARIIRDTRDHRDPYSTAWKTGLPVFICGGGKRLQCYRDMVVKLGHRLAASWKDFGGLVIKDIPKPDQLEAPNLAREEYDRLAVAYGLSFTSDEIGEVIPESQTTDIRIKRTAFDPDDIYVGKDMC